MEAKAVRNSRAGDAFHYRWAARRCLALLTPNSPLKRVTVEGSDQPWKPGEYVIDLAEHYEYDSTESVVYHQLKHSTVRVGHEFAFSELVPTFRQFAERFSANLSAIAKGEEKPQNVNFSLVTNRPVAASIKTALAALRVGDASRLRVKFERATGLRGNALQYFCEALSISDHEGNYLLQREALRVEMADYFAGSVEENAVHGLVALVADRALPESDGKILREDVLCKLGVAHSRQLFPAPAQFDELNVPIVREQQDALLASILASPHPTIIHAAGGVGKSVVARQLVQALPDGSWGLVYDCFGGGNYRNTSQSRHRATDGLVQMANEMAVAGLCRVLIPRFNEPPKETFLAFLERLRQATKTLRGICPDAKLVLFIDAADNAEMAAAEANDVCFVHALLRENVPQGCRLVALCRTERIDLLNPASTVIQQLLRPFNPSETGWHLRKKFPTASEQDVQEFHRLSGANPRVQASVLAAAHATVADLLGILGPSGMTSDDQIAAQLDAAIASLKDIHPKIYGAQIEAICTGLANLPPFIPLNILAAVAGVDEPTIKSFVSDLGRPLWLSDHAVQFRDEPTETWFSQRFRACPSQVRKFITALEPLALHSAYVARSLPQLLLRVGDYDRLIALALSEKFLPEDNPIDARDIRLYRLQFAFKAALQLGRWADASRLAFRAGEEVAGDHRQMELLASQVDLIPFFQSTHRVQELAYRGMLAPTDWRGSANVHSAALLSGVGDFGGEARAYLRGAQRWLELTVGQHAEPELEQDQPNEDDFLAFAWAHFNLEGPEGAAEFFLRWKPSAPLFGVAWMFVRRLVDANRFDELIEVAQTGAEQISLLLAAAEELLPFGKTPSQSSVRQGLAILAQEDFRLEEMIQHDFENHAVSGALSLCEAAAAQRIPASQILPVLEKCMSLLADGSIASAYRHTPRRVFLRGAALRAVLANTGEPTLDELLPKREQGSQPSHGGANLEKELKETINALLPWYYLRALLLVQDHAADAVDLEQLRNRAKTALYERYQPQDHLTYEMSSVHFEVLALKESATTQELDYFNRRILAKAERKFGLQARQSALRLAARLPHLAPLRDALEHSTCRTIEGSSEDSPQERARWYIGLARAVLSDSVADATAYFDLAVEAVSKFGDEINERWAAVCAVGDRAAEVASPDAVLTYRFVRCGEMVGKTIGREKYWDRNEVFRIAARLHLPSAFAALSRWRDRRIGSFGRQLCALAGEAVQRDFIIPACGWGFTGFLGCNAATDYASVCIGKEVDPANRRRMLRAAIHDLALNEAKAEEFEKLVSLANGFNEEKKRLTEIIQAATVNKQEYSTSFLHKEASSDIYSELFREINVLEAHSLSDALVTVRASNPMRDSGAFWEEVLRRVPRGQERKFLDAFLETENIDRHDAGRVVIHVRDTWLCKASIQRRWKPFLTGLGERFAYELAHSQREIIWGEQWAASVEESEAITTGMIRGLVNSVEAFDASAFFGFIANSTNHLTPDESSGLLDFALSRIESHIPDDFGDGTPSEWLMPKEDASGAMAGMVWSALGSPHSSTRWEAAHCVRRWAEMGCMTALDAMIRWMKKDEAGAYASKSYPFYRLHARLYLLIALARIAVDQPVLLRDHHRIFATIALEGLPHVLIQKNAADIALRLEWASPGTYEPEQIARLHLVGKSPFAMAPKTQSRGRRSSRGWGESDACAPFEQEFDWYWFDQISDIFGVSKKEIINIARDIAVQQFGVEAGERYIQDPRQEQWNAADHAGCDTSHSHGSYPINDTYSFYVSYHSFLCTASALLGRVPIVSDPDGWHDGDRWAYWVRRHSLTRQDGRWLADRRDPAPLQRRAWVHRPRHEPWEENVRNDDFVDVLTSLGGTDGFVCVHGTWSDHVDYRTEDLWVHSALVNPITAASLANSLRSVEDSRHFFLPTYECDDAEYSKGPFELLGWILQQDSGDPRLDRRDPHAANIDYPSLAIGSSFAAALGLSSDTERRKWWRDHDTGTPAVVSEVWSNQRSTQRNEPCRYGRRIRASVGLLKQLCRQTGKSLIFCVEIRRTMHRSNPDNTSASSYVPRSFKIFLFAADGILRDAEGSHRVG